MYTMFVLSVFILLVYSLLPVAFLTELCDMDLLNSRQIATGLKERMVQYEHVLCVDIAVHYQHFSRGH